MSDESLFFEIGMYNVPLHPHSLAIICRGWKGWVGRCVASMNNTAIRYNVSTEKVGAFRANKTQKGGLYRGTYPYYFNRYIRKQHILN